MKYDNPAGRLHAILQKGKSMPDHMVTREAWAQLLNVKADDTPLLLRKVADVMNLYSQTRQLVTELKHSDVELLTKDFAEIDAALSLVNFDATWNQFKSRLSPLVMRSLEWCSFELSRAGLDDGIPIAEL